EALLETKKRQNTHLDLEQSVEKLVRAGLDVMAGFIVGFDADDESIFERQRAFIARSPISMAMIGILTALPGTQLSRRLAAEGRLHGDAEGDAAYRPNFDPKMPEAALVEGYGRLLASLYEPRAYFGRALRAVFLQRDLPAPRYRRSLRYSRRLLAIPDARGADRAAPVRARVRAGRPRRAHDPLHLRGRAAAGGGAGAA